MPTKRTAMTTTTPAVKTDVLPATMTREQACDCVISGLNRIKDGLIAYYRLGLTYKDLESDLKEKGWKGSASSLRYHVARLREQGKIEAATKGKREDLKPQPLSPAQLQEEEQTINTIQEELKLFDVSWVEGLQARESELLKTNEELQSQVNYLELEVKELKSKLEVVK